MGGGGGGRDTAAMPGAQTQQIFIPNALVGASESLLLLRLFTLVLLLLLPFPLIYIAWMKKRYRSRETRNLADDSNR